MSLPPYKHTRNPALEKENEPLYESSTAPLITHSGIIEKRRTANSRIIRSQPVIPGIEFEYLPTSCLRISKHSRFQQHADTVSNEKTCREHKEFSKASGEFVSENKIEKEEKKLENKPKESTSSNEKDHVAQSINGPIFTANRLNSKTNTSQSLERHKTQKVTKSKSSFPRRLNETLINACDKTNYREYQYQEFSQPANGLDNLDQFRFMNR